MIVINHHVTFMTGNVLMLKAKGWVKKIVIRELPFDFYGGARMKFEKNRQDRSFE